MNAAETTPNERYPPPDRYRTSRGGPNPTRPCAFCNRIGLINRLELLSSDRNVHWERVTVPMRMPTARSKHVFRYREARTGRLPGYWDICRDTVWQSDDYEPSIGDRSMGSGETSWTERVHPDDLERVMDGVFATIKGQENAWSDEYRFHRGDGSYAEVQDRGFIIRDGQGRAVRMVGAMLDITERKLAEARIEALAYHDPLTGLPNRALLLDRLTQTLARAEREDLSSAVLFLDLDRFKAINDSLGHAVGDELLRQTAERLRTAIRKEDTVARIGGDEFVILIAQIGDAENAAGIASKVLAALRVPFIIYEHELSVMASCGIAISPADGTEAPMLLPHADTALY
ncbi:MAG: diguanylate cyclase domain-containing protein, partial [Gammaproteobacteria bacterium]